MFNAFILITCTLIWGSSFILMKFGSKTFGPEEITALRLTIAGLCTLPVSLYYIYKKKGRYPWGKILIAALSGNLIPYFIFAYVISGDRMSSSAVGIFNALTPLFTLLIGWVIFKTDTTLNKILGVAIGLVGAILLALQKEQPHHTAGHQLINGILLVIATLCYGINANFAKNKLKELKPAEITSLSLGFSAIPSALFLIIGSDFSRKMAESPDALQSLGAVFILGAFGTALAIFLFFILLERVSALFASSVTYLMPIVSVLWGIYFKENIGEYHYIGLGLILTGVWVANYWKPSGVVFGVLQKRV